MFIFLLGASAVTVFGMVWLTMGYRKPQTVWHWLSFVGSATVVVLVALALEIIALWPPVHLGVALMALLSLGLVLGLLFFLRLAGGGCSAQGRQGKGEDREDAA